MIRQNHKCTLERLKEMKREVFCSNIANVGDLFIDYVFFEFEMEPLLFTCIDRENKLYFCHCYKMLSEQKWFVVPVSERDLELLIEGRSDLRQMILSSSQILNITKDIKGREVGIWLNKSELSVEDLPLAGIKLRCEERSANSYIKNKIAETSDSQSLLLNYVINDDTTTKCVSVCPNIKLEESNVVAGIINSMCLAHRNVQYMKEEREQDSFYVGSKNVKYSEKTLYANFGSQDDCVA